MDELELAELLRRGAWGVGDGEEVSWSAERGL
jgi:hypothetical protein